MVLWFVWSRRLTNDVRTLCRSKVDYDVSVLIATKPMRLCPCQRLVSGPQSTMPTSPENGVFAVEDISNKHFMYSLYNRQCTRVHAGKPATPSSATHAHNSFLHSLLLHSSPTPQHSSHLLDTQVSTNIY